MSTVVILLYFFLFWLSGPLSVVVMPALAAFAVGCLSPANAGRPGMLVASAMAAFTGSLFSEIFLSAKAFEWYLITSPSYGDKITTKGLLLPLITRNVAESLPSLVFIGINVIFALIIAQALIYFKRQATEVRLSVAALVLVVLVFCGSSLAVSTDFRARAATEPENRTYSYDGLLFLKTFYLMEKAGFYESFLVAADNDARFLSQDIVRHGKFTAWLGSPINFRTPVLFIFWRVGTFGHGVGIYYWGLLFSVALLVTAYFAARLHLGNIAFLAPAAMAPYLFLTVNWSNLFLPDWWMGVALCTGILFWVMGRFSAAAIALLVAAVFREVGVVFLVFFLLTGLIMRNRSRLPLSAALFLFLLLYARHYYQAGALMDGGSTATAFMTGKLAFVNFLPTAHYMLFPYGFYFVPPLALIILAMFSWARLRRYELGVLSVLSMPYFAIASSYYWGQHLWPFLIFAIAVLPGRKLEPGLDS